MYTYRGQGIVKNMKSGSYQIYSFKTRQYSLSKVFTKIGIVFTEFKDIYIVIVKCIKNISKM